MLRQVRPLALEGDRGRPTCIEFDCTDARLLSTVGRIAKMWDASTGDLLGECDGREAVILDAILSRIDALLTTASHHEIHILDDVPNRVRYIETRLREAGWSVGLRMCSLEEVHRPSERTRPYHPSFAQTDWPRSELLR